MVLASCESRTLQVAALGMTNLGVALPVGNWLVAEGTEG